MTERVTSGFARLQDRFPAEVLLRSIPSHEQVLEIARTALREPGLLSDSDIRDLAQSMITHYAQMGIG